MRDTQQLVPARDLAAKNNAHYPNESAEYRAARNELLAEEIARHEIDVVQNTVRIANLPSPFHGFRIAHSQWHC